jgi:hypothetical protein
MSSPINIYCCYHNNDKASWENLEDHLVVLKRNGQIVTFGCLNISPGSDLIREQEARLVAADIVLLIISKYFLVDDQCWNMMLQAMGKYQSGELRVVPIRYRPIYYDSAPFAELSMLPTGNPICLWRNHDEAYVNIVNGISELVDSLRKEGNIQETVTYVYEQGKQLIVQPSETKKFLPITQEGNGQ